MTTTPPFTQEQLEWLEGNIPSGPYKRVLGDVKPTSDADQVGAYAALTKKQRDKLDADKASKEAQVKVYAATAQVTQAVTVAQAAVEAANSAGIEVSDVVTQVAAVTSVSEATPEASSDAPATEVKD